MAKGCINFVGVEGGNIVTGLPAIVAPGEMPSGSIVTVSPRRSFWRIEVRLGVIYCIRSLLLGGFDVSVVSCIAHLHGKCD